MKDRSWGRGVFLPGIYGGGVDGTKEGNNPLVERAAFNGKEGDRSPDGDGDGDGRPFEEEGETGGVEEEANDNTAGELEELFESHVTD